MTRHTYTAHSLTFDSIGLAAAMLILTCLCIRLSVEKTKVENKCRKVCHCTGYAYLDKQINVALPYTSDEARYRFYILYWSRLAIKKQQINGKSRDKYTYMRGKCVFEYATHWNLIAYRQNDEHIIHIVYCWNYVYGRHYNVCIFIVVIFGSHFSHSTHSFPSFSLSLVLVAILLILSLHSLLHTLISRQFCRQVSPGELKIVRCLRPIQKALLRARRMERQKNKPRAKIRIELILLWQLPHTSHSYYLLHCYCWYICLRKILLFLLLASFGCFCSLSLSLSFNINFA